jgi:hypothetical protein
VPHLLRHGTSQCKDCQIFVPLPTTYTNFRTTIKFSTCITMITDIYKITLHVDQEIKALLVKAVVYSNMEPTHDVLK